MDSGRGRGSRFATSASVSVVGASGPFDECVVHRSDLDHFGPLQWEASSNMGVWFDDKRCRVVLAGVAKASVILPIAEAISQLKWCWFWGRQRSVVDFEIFDGARHDFTSAILLYRNR